MKKNNYPIILLLIILADFVGCEKNATKGYPDPEDPGIAIFSNTGNNIASCYIDNKPWRTSDRVVFGLYSTSRYEIRIEKQTTATASDTLQLSWDGYFTPNTNNNGTLFCRLAIAKNFSYKNFAALATQRIVLNGNNGYFNTNISGINTANTKGTGNIYFHSVVLDSIGPASYSGKMSGLFEASFPAFKITKGRFDHLIDSVQIHL